MCGGTGCPKTNIKAEIAMAEESSNKRRVRITPFLVLLLGLLVGVIAVGLGVFGDMGTDMGRIPPIVGSVMVGLGVALGVTGLTMYLVGVVWWAARLAGRATAPEMLSSMREAVNLLHLISDR